MPKRATGAFMSNVNGRERVVTPDEIYADDNEIVEAYPHLFTDVVVIERATRGPGEQRDTRRPR